VDVSTTAILFWLVGSGSVFLSALADIAVINNIVKNIFIVCYMCLVFNILSIWLAVPAMRAKWLIV
jgi:hypothetical protein